MTIFLSTTTQVWCFSNLSQFPTLHTKKQESPLVGNYWFHPKDIHQTMLHYFIVRLKLNLMDSWTPNPGISSYPVKYTEYYIVLLSQVISSFFLGTQSLSNTSTLTGGQSWRCLEIPWWSFKTSFQPHHVAWHPPSKNPRGLTNHPGRKD